MMSTDQYCPTAHWFIGPGGSGMRRSRAEAYWRVLQNPQGATVEDISLIFFEQNANARYVDREDGDFAEDTCDCETFEEARDRALALRAQFEREEEEMEQRRQQRVRQPDAPRAA